MKKLVVLLILGGVFMVPSYASASSLRFLRVISPVSYEVIDPSKDLEITVQADTQLGYLEWYFDYIGDSYHRIPFVPVPSGTFTFRIPKEVLKKYRGVHFLHVHKIVFNTKRSWKSYGDTVILKIGGKERFHVVGIETELNSILIYGWTRSEALRYDKLGYGFSFRIDVTIFVQNQRFEILQAEVGTVWEKKDLNISKEMEEIKERYKKIYAKDFNVSVSEVKVNVKFQWLTNGNWRALFSTASLNWIREHGTVVILPDLNLTDLGGLGLNQIPFPPNSWKWDPYQEDEEHYELSIEY